MRLEALEQRRLLAVFDVNSVLDTVDANVGDGLAEDASGNTTLRAAIMEANASSDADTINLPAGTYNLTLTGFGEDAGLTGDLDLIYDATIVGEDADATIIDGQNQDRLFDLHDFVDLEIQNVTLTHGRAEYSSTATSEGCGGAIRTGFPSTLVLSGCVFVDNSSPVSTTGDRYGFGGAVYFDGFSVTIQECQFVGNLASNSGGAVYLSGPATISDSSFVNNTAYLGGGAITTWQPTTVETSTFSGNSSETVGGAILVNTQGEVTLTNSTISGNLGASGGGLYSNGSLTLASSTIADNAATSGSGGGVYASSSGTVASFENTLVAGNTASSTGPDVYGTITSLGSNLISDSSGSTGFGATGDQLDVEPLLGSLSDNGGATQTHALLTGSPAIDAANTATSPATDQRGIARPSGDEADIGAFELEPDAQISGAVFNDVDGNGVWDAGESALAGWEIYIDTNSNGQWDAGEPIATTDADGDYILSGLDSGTYTVAEVQQTGWTQTFPDSPGTHSVTVTAWAVVDSIDFGNQALSAEIHGAKWNDENGDGVWDADESAMADWEIYIDTNSNGQWDTGEPITATDADGVYVLSGLDSGTYTVAEVQQTGWTQTFPASPGTHSVTVATWAVVDGIDFGNQALPGEIHGAKWNDENSNGTWDADEPALAGWEIYLDLNENEQWDTGEPITTTAADGTYSFTELVPGVYTVREITQTGWEQTSPATAETITSFVSIDNDPEGDFPRDAAFTLDGQYVLVVNRDTDNVTVLNAATHALVATIPVGDSPRSVAVSSAYAVVANLNSNDVSIIDLSSWTVAASVPVTGTEPYRVAVSADGTAAVVGVLNAPGDGVASSFSVIDLTGTPTEVRTFDTTRQGTLSAWWVTTTGDGDYEYTRFALSPDNQTVVLPDPSGSQIMVYDWTTGTEVAGLACDAYPAGIDISDDGTVAVVSHRSTSADDVTVVDLSTATPTIAASFDITTSNLSNQVIRITPDKAHAVVAGSNYVYVVDLSTGSTTTSFSAGSVYDMAITYDGNYLLIASYNPEILDLSSFQVVKTFDGLSSQIAAASPTDYRVVCLNFQAAEDVQFFNANGVSASVEGVVPSGGVPEGDSPRRLAVSPDGSIAITGNTTSKNVSIIDLATQTVRAYVDTGDTVESVAITPDGGTAVVANTGSDTISIIDLSIDAVVKTLDTAGGASEIVISPDGQWAYVICGSGTDKISFVQLNGAASSVEATLAVGNYGRFSAYEYTMTSGLALSPDGSVLAACSSFTDELILIDTAAQSLIAAVSIGSGTRPIQAAFSPDGSMVYVLNNGTDSVSVVSVAGVSSAVVATVNGMDEPATVNVDADGAFVYVGNNGSTNPGVKVIDTSTNTVVLSISLPNSGAARSAYLSDANSILYVTGLRSSGAGVYRIDAQGAASSVIDEVVLDSGVMSLGFCELDNTVVVTEPRADGVAVVDYSNFTPYAHVVDVSPGESVENIDFGNHAETTNQPPTLDLTNTITSLSEDTDVTSRVKVADIVVTDDGPGSNSLSLTGADAALFEIIGAELYLIAGTTLDFETNPILDVTVQVDDTSVGTTPDDSAALAISVIETPWFDFGDAPLPYATTLAQNGACHTPTGPTLGSQRDSEPNGLASTGADGDDTNGTPDDEDGVAIGAIQVGQLGASAIVNVQNAPSGAILDAWIDFNGDGSWGGPMEQIAHSVFVTEGDNTLVFDVPSWAIQGETYARFRLSTAGGLAPAGLADDGEVEDYQVAIAASAETSGVFSSAHVVTEACSNPSDIRIVDMDGDGDMDLLAAAAGSNTIAWYENDGNEYFTSHPIATWVRQVQSVTAVDVDGDGDLDVLSASAQDDRIVWFENDGYQNFTPTMLSTTADGAQCVFAADVDGDGDMDVLSASYNDDTIAWYENDGGSFTRHTITASADGAISVFAEDVDGDGDMDVLSASAEDSTIAWYENDGSENFLVHAITRAAAARSVFASDLDEDGDIDVITASSGDNTIAWYENDGFENFTAHTISTTADGARMIYVEDVDGDGDLDVLSASVDDDTVSWYENDGVENFTARVVSSEVDGARSVFASDLDGDGDLDVVAASSYEARVAWYENDGAENFALHTVMMPADGATAVFAADMDGDGDMDVLSAAQYDNEIAWYENDGSERFVAHTVATMPGASAVFAADVDGDGDMDVLSASSQSDTIAWYENDGSGAFTTRTITSSADGAISVYAADVDGDGDLDVLCSSYADDVIAWYENDGSQSFTAHTISTLADGPMSVFAADVDGDGDMDVLSASSYDGRIAWYENDGAGGFTAYTITTSATSAYAVFAADVDSDGDMDVLSASVGEDMIAWYENDGSQSFTAHTITTSAVDANSVFAADLDGDGDVDVLSAASNGNKIHWYENDGAENFTAYTITAETPGANCVFAADVDGDGDLDVLSSSFSDDKIAWYENLAFDYGDAPAPYPTLASDNGAYHTPIGPMLGKARDDEQNGQPTGDADGDDTTGMPDDEDGLVEKSVLARGESAYFDVQVSAASYLNLWIDFNGDGDWDDSGEHITGTDIPMTAGVNRITFRVPTDANLGLTYARLRLTSYDTGGSLTPTGEADDGEVEDYSLAVGDVLRLYGDDGVNDMIYVWPSVPGQSFHKVAINGEVTTYDAAIYSVIRINALDGSDTITIIGTDAAENARLGARSVSVTSSGYAVYGANVETIFVDGGGGTDEVTLIGSSGSNRLYSYADSTRMSDSPRTYSHRVDGFETVSVDGSAGTGNYAFFYDSPEDDVLSASPEGVELSREDGTTARSARGFEKVYVYATEGGDDSASLVGADGARNRLYSYADRTTFTESARSFYFYVQGFDSVAVDSPGNATAYAYVYDSLGNDTFKATPTSATMDRAEPYSDLTTTGFSRVYAYSTGGGDDGAVLSGSDGGNRYRGYPTYSTLTDAGSSFYHYARGFKSLTAIGCSSDSSEDRAYLYDSSGDDTLVAAFEEGQFFQGATLSDTAGSYANSVAYFDLVYARSSDRGTVDTIDVDEELLAFELIHSGSW